MASSKNNKGSPPRDCNAESPEPSDDNRGGGYCSPPLHSRWQKGTSGNPRGRPRKLKPLTFSQKLEPFRDLIFEEMERPIEIKEGGQRIEIETGRAILRSLAIGAMQGDLRKQRLALGYMSAAAQSSKADRAEDARFVTFYKAKWDPIFSSAVKLGKPEPEQLPHPDHLIIDLATGNMVISGPLTLAEKQSWDFLKFQLRENTKHLDRMIADAAVSPRNRSAAKSVASVQQHLASLEKKVPPGWSWREELGWEDAYAEKIFAHRKPPD